ncbi:MAG: hypothetical protein CSA62_05660 [Planctomycetota bacterium]|nr:MAG: hypothetical protein CSA62_05660 [Planctomycetota bacterium]
MSRTKVARKPRFKARHNVVEVYILDWTENDNCLGLILDVAEGGVCLRSPLQLPVGATVELRVMLGGSEEELLASVRWSSGDDGVFESGLMFLQGETGPGNELGRRLLEELSEAQ